MAYGSSRAKLCVHGNAALDMSLLVCDEGLVTAPPEREVLLAGIMDSALDAIIAMDHAGRIVEFNPAAETIFGYKRADVLGREMAEIIVPPRLRVQHRNGFARYLATGQATVLGRRIELSGQRADGSEFPAEISICALRVVGQPLFVGHVRDITERKRAEETEKALFEQAQTAIRFRDEFLSVASHELRTPLTALALQVELLTRVMKSHTDAEARVPVASLSKTVVTIDRQVERLGRLVGALLDVTRSQHGTLTLQRELVDLTALARDIVVRFEVAAAKAGCVLTLRAAAPVMGSWDRLRVEQALTNLLSNALQYAAGKPVLVCVEASTDAARLSVTDEGTGIAEGDLERIFECFERAASSRHHGGLGLGLYVTRQIVEAHGGHVRVHSVPGQGSSFMIEFPLPGAGDTQLEAM